MAGARPLRSRCRTTNGCSMCLAGRWRCCAAQGVSGKRPATYVFLSSQYAVAFDAQQPPTVEARFRVAVIVGRRNIDPASPFQRDVGRSRRVPRERPTASGAEDRGCVRADAESCGFCRRWNRAQRSAIESDRPRRPVEAARPLPKRTARKPSPDRLPAPPRTVSALPRPRIFEITLSFFPESNGTMAPAGLRVRRAENGKRPAPGAQAGPCRRR